MTRIPGSAVLLLALSWGCGRGAPKASFVGNVFTRDGERFRVRPLPPPWERARAGGDLAWVHPPTSAVITANADCSKARRPPLEILMHDLVIGTTHRWYLLEERAVVSGRDALHDVILLRVDGMPLVYDLYVFREGACVYDLALVSPPAAYDRVADAYVAFVQGFRGLGPGP